MLKMACVSLSVEFTAKYYHTAIQYKERSKHSNRDLSLHIEADFEFLYLHCNAEEKGEELHNTNQNNIVSYIGIGWAVEAFSPYRTLLHCDQL